MPIPHIFLCAFLLKTFREVTLDYNSGNCKQCTFNSKRSDNRIVHNITYGEQNKLETGKI